MTSDVGSFILLGKSSQDFWAGHMRHLLMTCNVVGPNHLFLFHKMVYYSCYKNWDSSSNGLPPPWIPSLVIGRNLQGVDNPKFYSDGAFNIHGRFGNNHSQETKHAEVNYEEEGSRKLIPQAQICTRKVFQIFTQSPLEGRSSWESKRIFCFRI